MSEPVRYIVDVIESKYEQFFRDLGIKQGDTIEVSDGFPSSPDLPEPGEPVTLSRELHPNISWCLGSSVDEGLLTLRRVWSYEEVVS